MSGSAACAGVTSGAVACAARRPHGVWVFSLLSRGCCGAAVGGRVSSGSPLAGAKLQ